MKKLFFFFLLLIFNSKNVFELKAENPDPGCASEISENYLIKYDYLKIDRIEIETVNYRNWTVNSIKILTSNTRYIDDIYKKRFKAKITVTFEDGSQCVYTGRIRHSGDQKDHISLHDNYILQSVDVHLDNGNIRGITKFKLLRPNTRGVLEDVIIQTQLLRELKYLAPRSIKVKAKINEAESTMLFQEKASKELLEFNNRREGPILEANEKYFWKALKDIPDNQLSNWSAGVVPIHNKSAKIMLTKLTNSNLVTKNNNLKKISLEALSKLNLIYLYYANMFQDGKKNNYNHSDYDLDNNLLGLFEKKNILKLDVYNLLLQATNSNHGLASNNRKFYWNSFDSYFEPINYDANPNINDDLAIGKFRLPISSDYLSSIELLEGKIKNVNIKNFKENLYSSGIDISELDLKRKFNKIIQNLETLKNNYENFVKDEDIAYNQFKNSKNLYDIFHTNIKDIEPNLNIVIHNEADDTLMSCNISNHNCENINFTNKNVADLLEGDFVLNDLPYQYLGKKYDLIKFNEFKDYNKIMFNQTNIFFEKNVNIIINELKNTVEIYQQSPGSRVFFKGGELIDTIIIFNGFKIKDKNNPDLSVFPPNYPINNKTLTGCLSFIDLNLSNISLKATNSSCEDTVNFINTDGNIKDIIIKNSFSDALDVDFSRLKINNINIDFALNDCVDFSGGKYELEKLNLNNCGDKALSVGEKSFVKINEILASNSNIGIASKDSSIVNVETLNLNNLETCLSSYKKKQEFFGSYIKVNNLTCHNYFTKVDVDNFSIIYEKDSKLKNFTFGKKYISNNSKEEKINDKKLNVNFHRDYKSINDDKSVNVVIEIPAGTSEKWEVSKSSSGRIKREFYMGEPRVINYKPYPINYGIIPNTVLPLRVGGDGDPLDVIVLGPPLNKGDIVKVKVLGILKMKDFGDIDDKIVAVPLNNKFSKFENLLHFKSENLEQLKEITDWFENYKGKNVVTFENFGTVIEAKKLIKFTNQEYKKSGLNPRG